MFRKSCGKCHFTNLHRPSDITIADFWGWEKTNPRINADDKGCSLVLLNTEKGRKLFEAVKDNMNTFPANLNDCLQPNMVHPSEIHPKREQFEREYIKKGFEYVYLKYCQKTKKEQMQDLLSKIKRLVKKILGYA